MTKFSMAMVAVVGMSGLALAGDPKAGTPTAGAKVDTKVDAKVDAKAATPAAGAKVDAKVDTKAGAKMEMPKVPQEMMDMAKTAVGTWRCKGQGMNMETNAMTDMNATMKITHDVDKWWLHGSYSSMMGKMPFKFESYTTYDAAAKKWRRVMVESGGGWATGESMGLKDGKIDWELSAHSMMGDAMFRDHEDLTDLKTGVKMWGEVSMDKGKTWSKVYENTCKK